MKTMITLIAMAITLPVCAQHTLTVNVSNIEKIEGEVEICLFNKAEDFMKNAVACRYVPVESEVLSYKFENINQGDYAVIIYQDLNGNRDLDTNWMRIPNEPYGFSNNPSTTFGPPDFEKSSFGVAANKSIDIKLK